MNQAILAQARRFYHHVINGGELKPEDVSYMVSALEEAYDNEEKFAELIVCECCDKLMEMHEKVNGDHNYYHHASVQLKQHFGVE